MDWPPYAFIGEPPESDFDVAGFGHDVAHGMGDLCGLDVTTVQTKWSGLGGGGGASELMTTLGLERMKTHTHTRFFNKN